MSHGDHVLSLPPGFRVTGATGSALSAVEDPQRRIFAVQFHPEVNHTERGTDILRNFVFRVCGAQPNWSGSSFIAETVEAIRKQVGDQRAICALSGGVDSAVAAALVHRAIGDRLTNIFVDNGLLRKNEFHETIELLEQRVGLRVIGVDASARFLERLAGVTDPEVKRKRIGAEFIRVFADEARHLGDVRFLVQGTLYPDVIESVAVRGPSATIKTHHNVGGLPPDLPFQLIEPLRELFKDEVRRIGRELGLPEEMLTKQPFPGPGLAVRLLGEVIPERLATLRDADAIVVEEIRAAGLYEKTWQAFAVLLPVRSVGVMGDERSYGDTVAVRVVQSEDAMTADWVRLPGEVLERMSTRIVNEVARCESSRLRHQFEAAKHNRMGIGAVAGRELIRTEGHPVRSVSRAGKIPAPTLPRISHSRTRAGEPFGLEKRLKDWPGVTGGDDPRESRLPVRHFLRHVQQKPPVAFVDATQQSAEHAQEASFFSGGAPGNFVCRPAFGQVRQFRGLLAIVKQLIQGHFQSARHFFESLNGRHGMAIFDPGDVATEQSGTLFDVSLGQLLFFAQCAQPIADNHAHIVPYDYGVRKINSNVTLGKRL